MSDLLNSDDNQNTEQAQDSVDTQEQEQSFLTWNEREFKTKDEVIKKFEHADSFIQDMKQKQEELEKALAEKEAKLQQATKLEEAMEQLKRQNESQSAGETTTQPNAPTGMQFDEEGFLQKAEQRVLDAQRKEAQRQQEEANLRQVHEAAEARYGKGYLSALVEQAKKEDLDYQTEQELIELARTKPKTLNKLFGLTTERKPTAAPSGGLNVSSASKAAPSNSFADIAAETAKKYGLEYGKGFHSN